MAGAVGGDEGQDCQDSPGCCHRRGSRTNSLGVVAGTPHRVVALAVPDVVAFDLSIAAQIFGHRDERDRYSFAVCAEQPGSVPSTTGFAIGAPHGLDVLDAADTVIVPGFLPLTDPPPATLDALSRAAARGARVASVCVGAFALAAAGLLDGLVATTHWQEADAFRARFPRVRLNPEVLYVDAGPILTSAGLSAGIDLCLHLVQQDYGAAAAADVARRMVVAVHRPGGQAQYARGPLPGTGGLGDTCDWAVTQMHRTLTVDHLARHAGMSPRTFVRRFHDATGMTPIRWLAGQRLLEAQRLLESTRLTVDDVAARCGMGSAANLRLHMGRRLGTTPTAYRTNHRRAGGPHGRRD
jgi:transcriptional regulator GlxA family with amidase domain